MGDGKVIATNNNGRHAVAERDEATDLTGLARVLIQGDLSRLNDDQKSRYYLAVCEASGLNPALKPFSYCKMKGGGTILYANKSAAEQLRVIHGVTLRVTKTEERDGILSVTVEATARDGRMDTDLGAVPVAGLLGEDRANAFMKCVTKAKRRVTLSLCGLGMMDETEAETVGIRIEGPTPVRRALPAPRPPEPEDGDPTPWSGEGGPEWTRTGGPEGDNAEPPYLAEPMPPEEHEPERPAPTHDDDPDDPRGDGWIPAPVVLQNAVLTRLHDLDLTWHSTNVKTAVGKHINRVIPDNAPLANLDEREAQVIIEKLDERLAEKKKRGRKKEAVA